MVFFTASLKFDGSELISVVKQHLIGPDGICVNVEDEVCLFVVVRYAIHIPTDCFVLNQNNSAVFADWVRSCFRRLRVSEKQI